MFTEQLGDVPETVGYSEGGISTTGGLIVNCTSLQFRLESGSKSVKPILAGKPRVRIWSAIEEIVGGSLTGVTNAVKD